MMWKEDGLKYSLISRGIRKFMKAFILDFAAGDSGRIR